MPDRFVFHEVDTVDCAYEPIDWAFARDHAADIEARWRAMTAEKPALFNGRVLLLHRWSIEGRVFRGAYLETDYAAFIAFRDLGFPEKGKRNCFAMAALRSADGAFLLGEMGQQTANAGAIYFAAGTPDRKDVKGDRVDLAGSVLRELHEETGLSERDVTVEPGWTVVLEGGRIALMRRVKSPLQAADLEERIAEFLALDPEPELARMHVVRSEADIPADHMPPFQQAYLRYEFARDRERATPPG